VGLYAGGDELIVGENQMFIITGRDEYAHAAASAALFGTPFESLADWAAQQKAKEDAAKLLCFADWRKKLRPSLTAATTES
jgi:hypothetical protein